MKIYLFILLFFQALNLFAVEEKKVAILPSAGIGFKDNDRYTQFDLTLGYSVNDSFLIGIASKYNYNLKDNRADKGLVFFGMDFRWFFEPFEFAVVPGVRIVNFNQNTVTNIKRDIFTVIGEANYLFKLRDRIFLSTGVQGSYPFSDSEKTLYSINFGLRFFI